MMMIEAKKRAQVRRGSVRFGKLRRGPGGVVAMDFLEEFTDLGAPEYAVTGIASIERISAGQVRFTKFSRRRDGNVVTHHEVWDIEQWKRDFANYERALQILERLPIPDGPEAERKRGRH